MTAESTWWNLADSSAHNPDAVVKCICRDLCENFVSGTGLVRIFLKAKEAGGRCGSTQGFLPAVVWTSKNQLFVGLFVLDFFTLKYFVAGYRVK